MTVMFHPAGVAHGGPSRRLRISNRESLVASIAELEDLPCVCEVHLLESTAYD